MAPGPERQQYATCFPSFCLIRYLLLTYGAGGGGGVMCGGECACAEHECGSQSQLPSLLPPRVSQGQNSGHQLGGEHFDALSNLASLASSTMPGGPNFQLCWDMRRQPHLPLRALSENGQVWGGDTHPGQCGTHVPAPHSPTWKSWTPFTLPGEREATSPSC